MEGALPSERQSTIATGQFCRFKARRAEGELTQVFKDNLKIAGNERGCGE
jgi:hypothetical protein